MSFLSSLRDFFRPVSSDSDIDSLSPAPHPGISLSSSSSSPPLFLIFIHDSSGVGMYHASPSVEHLAHALGCCTVENADDAFLTPLASLSSYSVTPIARFTSKLTEIPSFVEAQRVLSQAQASTEAPSP